jgi:HAD superfamily hydrolase (TIGR01509 family)
VKPTLFFDFDGVLCDSTGTLEEYFIQKHKFTKESLQKSFEKNIYENKQISEIIENEKEELDNHFLTNINKHHFFKGAKESITYFKQSFDLFIVSSAPTQNIIEHLSHINAQNDFKEILGGDFERSKKKKFEYLIQKYNLKKENIIFITDTLGDILEANAVGIKTIGVTWGVHFKETLNQGKPFAIVESFEELKERIEKYFSFILEENSQ